MGAKGSGTHLSTASTGSQAGKDGVRKGQTRCGRGEESETPPSCTLEGQQGQLVSLSEKQNTGDKPT